VLAHFREFLRELVQKRVQPVFLDAEQNFLLPQAGSSVFVALALLSSPSSVLTSI